MKTSFSGLAVTAMTLVAASGALFLGAQPLRAEAGAEAVIETYADIALAKYEDSLQTARQLDKALDELLAAPSEAALKAAREAWLAARVPYQQSEVYHFGNAIVDDWEGKVNAWPLNEGLGGRFLRVTVSFNSALRPLRRRREVVDRQAHNQAMAK